jgi:thiol-disulfide isomerase/thioredoxin
MDSESKKKRLSVFLNYALLAVALVLLFSPGAKSWFLEKLVSVGLFNAEMKTGDKPAPVAPNDLSFGYRNTEGKFLNTSDLKGKVVFINFWASWCPPCLAEMPSLDKLYRQFQNDSRIVFLFVNEDDDNAKAEQFLRDKNYKLPLIKSSGPVPAEIYDGTLPTTVVLDKMGKVVYKHTGIANYNTDKFVDQLKDLF